MSILNNPFSPQETFFREYHRSKAERVGDFLMRPELEQGKIKVAAFAVLFFLSVSTFGVYGILFVGVNTLHRILRNNHFGRDFAIRTDNSIKEISFPLDSTRFRRIIYLDLPARLNAARTNLLGHNYEFQILTDALNRDVPTAFFVRVNDADDASLNPLYPLIEGRPHVVLYRVENLDEVHRLAQEAHHRYKAWPLLSRWSIRFPAHIPVRTSLHSR